MRFLRLLCRFMEPHAHIHSNINIAGKYLFSRTCSSCFVLCLALRKPYKQPHEFFGIEHLVAKEPISQFKKWFEEAYEYVDEPNGFCLSTATK